MTDQIHPEPEDISSQLLTQEFSDKLAKLEPSRREKVLRAILLAALGTIPWVGGFMSALAAVRNEHVQGKRDNLQNQWLEEHGKKIQELADTLIKMVARLESFGEEVKSRLESEEYLALIRKGFRQWDQADTQEKKKLIANLLTNAGATNITTDDVIRLFLDWIDAYHEIHFAVISEIYKHRGITRASIWRNIKGRFPREDSAEADLFKMLIRDLSMGGVVRQHRATTHDGQFIAKRAAKGSRSSGLMKSAFDDEEGYELTELGRQFVHYTMQDLVPQIKA